MTTIRFWTGDGGSAWSAGAFRRFAYAVLKGYNRLFFGLRVRGRKTSRDRRRRSDHLQPRQYDRLYLCGLPVRKEKPYFPTLKSNLEIPVIRKLVEYLGGFPIPETPKAFRSFSRKIEEMLREESGSICSLRDT